MPLGRFFRSPPQERSAYILYNRVVEQARHPDFYTLGAVPDTLDGRFDVLMVHAFLLMHRLRGEGEAARGLSQQVFDIMFGDMDRSLREMGVGDMGIGKRIKKMAADFSGRMVAYGAGVDGAPGLLEDALQRNLYRHVAAEAAPAAEMAAYMRRQARHLADQTAAGIMLGQVHFLPYGSAGESA